MTPAEFKTKWAKVTAKESSAYQSHFDDLCRMLDVAPPLEADPSGEDFFCFQKGVIKDAGAPDGTGPDGKKRKGWADVWRKGCFGWEYKGQHKDLDEAHRQLRQYRESLESPPLLVVCDFNRFIIHANFTDAVPHEYAFTRDQIDTPEVLRLLRSLFT